MQNQPGGYSTREPGAQGQEKNICKTAGCSEYPHTDGYCHDCYYNIWRTRGRGEIPPDGNRCKGSACMRRPTPNRLGYCEQCYEARYLVGGEDSF